MDRPTWARMEVLFVQQIRATQALGTVLRDAGLCAIRYRSARGTERGVTIGVFDRAVLGRRQPPIRGMLGPFAAR